jgi:hypothetical protein
VWVVKRESVRVECLSCILTYAGVLFCMGENVWESVVSESRESEREGEGRVVVVGGRGQRATGKRAIDSYQRFQGKGGTAREGNETPLQLCDWLPALLENDSYCTLPFCTVILRPAPVDFLRDFRHSHLRFGPKLAGKKPGFFARMSLQPFSRP